MINPFMDSYLRLLRWQKICEVGPTGRSRFQEACLGGHILYFFLSSPSLPLCYDVCQFLCDFGLPHSPCHDGLLPYMPRNTHGLNPLRMMAERNTSSFTCLPQHFGHIEESRWNMTSEEGTALARVCQHGEPGQQQSPQPQPCSRLICYLVLIS